MKCIVVIHFFMLTKENCSEKEVNFRVLQVLRNILHIKKSEESLVVRNFGTASQNYFYYQYFE